MGFRAIRRVEKGNLLSTVLLEGDSQNDPENEQMTPFLGSLGVEEVDRSE